MSQNFKAVTQLQAELHLLKVEKLEACDPFSQIQSHMINSLQGIFHCQVTMYLSKLCIGTHKIYDVMKYKHSINSINGRRITNGK